MLDELYEAIAHLADFRQSFRPIEFPAGDGHRHLLLCVLLLCELRHRSVESLRAHLCLGLLSIVLIHG